MTVRRCCLVLAIGLALGAVGCDGSLGGGPAGPSGDPRDRPPVDPDEPGEPAEQLPLSAGLRRLTLVQYDSSIRDLLGDDLRLGAQIDADPVAAEGFEFSDVLVSTGPLGGQSLLKLDHAAYAAAAAVFGDPARAEAFVGCAPSSAADPCVRAFLDRFLRRAFRRATEPDQVDAYLRVVAAGETQLGTVAEGLELVVAAVLQSPYFLYRTEIGSAGPDGVRRYDDWEMASRLSYFVWDTTPDDELLDAASRGELSTDAGLRAQVDRLLASPRAQQPVLRFFGEWLGLDGLDRLAKDPREFPSYSPTLGPAMRRELEAVITNELVLDEGNILDLFTIEHTYVDAELARFYGVDAPGAPAATIVDHHEAEASSPSGCAVVEGFANLCFETTLERAVTVSTAGRHRISARVYGTAAGSEDAQMVVSLDGAPLGTIDVGATETAPQVVVFDRDLSVGTHRIAIAFTNDFYEPPLNRDLRIDWVRVEALGTASEELVRVALPAERRGILSLGGLMARYAQTIDTSAVQRGLLIRERMLCDHIDAPPNDAETTLPPPVPGGAVTMRERLSAHLGEDPTCAGCHVRIDPLGLPLEHFDGIGAYRADDHGMPIDATGEVDGVPLDGAIELGSVLADAPRVRECIVRQMVRHATGVREHHRNHQGSIDAVETAAAEQGFTLASLIAEIVMSDAFRLAGDAR